MPPLVPAAVHVLGEATPRPAPAAAVAGLRAADGLKRAGHRVRRELASGHDRVAAVGGNNPVVRAAAGMLHHAVRAAHAQLIDQRRDGVLRGHQRVHRIGRRAAGRGPAGRAPPVGCEGSQQAALAEDVATAQRRRLLGDLLEAERALQLLARLRFIKQLLVLEHLHQLRRRGRRAGRGIRFQLQPRALGARHVRPAASGLGQPLVAEPGQRPVRTFDWCIRLVISSSARLSHSARSNSMKPSTWEKQVLSARGFKRVGRRSKYAM